MKMKRPNSFRGIENLQASALSFPRETIVAARNAEMEAAGKLANGGLKNPSVLAQRVIEETQCAVRMNIPTRKANEFVRQFAFCQTAQTVVEEDVRIGDSHSMTSQKLVRIGE
jgi:hypothetical protein